MLFRELIWVQKLVEFGSFNKAAQELFISPQALRASVTTLENKLGFPLFTRTRYGCQLTPHGERVVADFNRIVAMEHSWIRDYHMNVHPPISVVASTGAYNAVLKQLVAELSQEDFPAEISLIEARENRALELIAQKHSIGCLASAPEGMARSKVASYARDHALEVEYIGQDQFYIMLNAEHPLASKTKISVFDLCVLKAAMYPLETRNFLYKDIYTYFSPSRTYQFSQFDSICQIIKDKPDVAAIFPGVITKNVHWFESGELVMRQFSDRTMPAVSCLIAPPASARSEEMNLLYQRIIEKIHALDLSADSICK